jgi:hypothetical protein
MDRLGNGREETLAVAIRRGRSTIRRLLTIPRWRYCSGNINDLCYTTISTVIDIIYVKR